MDAAISGLKDLARQSVVKGEVPDLSIAIVYRDEVVYLGGFGLREAGKPERADDDTVFQLASVSKSLSATTVSALVGEGKVSWDSRISDLDPAFALHDAYPTAELTVRDLFSHRSGLPGDAGNDIEGLGYDRPEYLRRLRYLKAASSFRAGYAYSNAGLTEGAIAAAKAVGKEWEDVADEKLYKPLGMSSTSSRYRDFVAKTNRAALHVRVDGKWTALVRRNPDLQAPAGGVSSTARDLAQWVRLELGKGKYDGKQLIPEAAIEQTHIPVIVSGRDFITGGSSFYGLGWGINYRAHGVEWSHAGAFSTGARTLVHLIPDEQLGIVVLSNAFPSGLPEGLAFSFFDLVFDGKVQRDWVTLYDEGYDRLFGTIAMKAAMEPYAKAPASPAAALSNAAYIGTYTNDYVGDAEVLEEDGKLVLQLGPARRRFKLSHFERDLFLYAPDAETPDWLVSAVFAIGPDGKARQLTLESANSHGGGILVRK